MTTGWDPGNENDPYDKACTYIGGLDPEEETNALDTFLKQRSYTPHVTHTVQDLEESGLGRVFDGDVPNSMLLLDKKAHTSKYAKNLEMDRIVKIPINPPMTKEQLELFNYYHVNAEMYQRGWRLFTPQAEALRAFQQTGGGFFPIGVGFGKTLVTLMIANHAFKQGTKKILLLLPPEVLQQLVTVDIKMARRHVAISYPIMVLGNKSARERKRIADSGNKGLYIMPYSLLSVKDTDYLLEAIRPELIECDEAHKLKNKSAARTGRLLKYVDKYRPAGVHLSGTITSKSIRDYYHLIRWALGENNPLPNTASLANEWAAVIDSDGSVQDGPVVSNTGPLLPLVEWAQTNFPTEHITEDKTGFRKAYRCRLVSAPGVVSSGDLDIGVSLILQNTPVQNPENRPGWEELTELIRVVQEEDRTPNGDEIAHAIHKWKWFNELTAGFYNELIWPSTEKYAKRKDISEEEAEDILDRAKLHQEAGQAYNSVLRTWLRERGRSGLDTPDLVGLDMSNHGAQNVGTDLYEAWMYHKSLDFEGRPDRDARAVRVCDYKVHAATQWAMELSEEGIGAIIWVMHQEMGIWMVESLQAAGVDAIHCPAGPKGNFDIINPENEHRIMVASIPAHSTGKNLQAFSNQVFVEWPRNPITAEQALGRLHRSGQRSDEIIAGTFNTLEFDFLSFAACLNDALYIHQTTGNRQKLVYASYDPLPVIMPSEVLRERGLQNKQLSAEQRELMEDKFGSMK
jgi:hypothetical protein